MSKNISPLNISQILGREELSDLFENQGVTGFDLERSLHTVEEINRLKKEKGAIIFAHYYVRDGIKYGVADFVGDSLELSKAAMETDARLILFCGVHFMAETAKILNPTKKVVIPSLEAGCSLAESITAEDVRDLRKIHPEAAFVCYVNTTAAVKAEVDVCVTSANAVKIVRKLPQQKIVFLPDLYMGQNLQEEIPDKEIINWQGKCIVHEQFSTEQIAHYRREIPGLRVLAHYECDPSVLRAADMHGGTSDMKRDIANTEAAAYLLATECGLPSTLKMEFPEKNIVGPCTLCPYMKKNNLENAKDALVNEKPEIIVPEEMRIKAYRPIQRMFELMT